MTSEAQVWRNNCRFTFEDIYYNKNDMVKYVVILFVKMCRNMTIAQTRHNIIEIIDIKNTDKKEA